jgi:hypothetical protein
MVGKFFYFSGVMIRFWQTFGQTNTQTFGVGWGTDGDSFAGDLQTFVGFWVNVWSERS